MPIIHFSDEELNDGTLYDRMCICGHKLSFHGFVVLWSMHQVIVSQCVHHDCSHSEEIPRTDRRRKQTYKFVQECKEFRPA
jgi:hypothetical protein